MWHGHHTVGGGETPGGPAFRRPRGADQPSPARRPRAIALGYLKLPCPAHSASAGWVPIGWLVVSDPGSGRKSYALFSFSGMTQSYPGVIEDLSTPGAPLKHETVVGRASRWH